MSTIPKSTFSEAFVRLNRLDELGFARWAFQPGMEFATQDKWWEQPGSRPTSHEGIDFCCFEKRNGQLVDLAENTLVPVLYDGTVVKIFKDLLGVSILVAHDFQDMGKKLYSIYAHTSPVEILRAGSMVKAGEPIATICSTENKGVNPHLHLSVIWAHEATVGDLDWQTIHDVQGVNLCNPQDFL